MTHSLTLGSLLLTDSLPDDDYGYEFNVLADGASIGVANGVQEVVRSLLADGELTRVTRYGNREVTFSVEITGPSLAALSQGEAALRGEVGRSNTLTWEAPDYLAPVTLFEVVTSSMVQKFDDLAELKNRRTFTLTLTCSPFAMSADETTVPALAAAGGSPTTVSVNTADTTTNWFATVADYSVRGSTAAPTAVVDMGDYLQVSGSGYWLSLKLTLNTGSVALAGTRYLLVEVSGSPSPQFGLTLDGVYRSVSPVAVRALTTGVTQVVLDCGTATTLGALVIGFDLKSNSVESRIINVHDVTRTSEIPQTSPRQSSRIIEVGGTERAPASLRAYASSGSLGTTLIHTTPHDGSGYTPNMRRWRASGNTTAVNADTRRITGTWEPLKPNPVVSRTPAHSLPRGDYLLVAAIKCDTVTTTTPYPINWAVKSVISGQVLGSNEGTGYGWFPIANQLTIVQIASFAAPVVRSGALDVEVHLLNPTSTLAMSVEEWWMFKDDEDSALSVVNTSEGNLWLDSPDVQSGVPEVWVGPSKPFAYHPAGGLAAPGQHTFKSGPVLVTSISDSNDYLQVDMTYRKRWHSNAAE